MYNGLWVSSQLLFIASPTHQSRIFAVFITALYTHFIRRLQTADYRYKWGTAMQVTDPDSWTSLSTWVLEHEKMLLRSKDCIQSSVRWQAGCWALSFVHMTRIRLCRCASRKCASSLSSSFVSHIHSCFSQRTKCPLCSLLFLCLVVCLKSHFFTQKKGGSGAAGGVSSIVRERTQKIKRRLGFLNWMVSRLSSFSKSINIFNFLIIDLNTRLFQGDGNDDLRKD